MAAWAGIAIPWLGTALGAALVFLMKGGVGRRTQAALSGAAAGIMTAASFFSLLAPAIEQGGAFPAAAGFLLGALLLPCADRAAERSADARGRRRVLTGTEKMLLAVTVHNLPEGMAVGAAWAAYAHTGRPAALAGAASLAVGIALQNIPEGAVVSLPLRAAGMKKAWAFGLGVLSGAVEPAGALMLLGAAEVFSPLLPWCLAFAAGAMLSAVTEELIPDAAGRGGRFGGLAFSLGFLVMMLMDVLCG